MSSLSTESANKQEVGFRPLRVFVVENHPDTLACLKMYLTHKGHTVVTARNLGEAVSALPDANCQVVLTDIGLPDGMGWDLLQQTHMTNQIYAIAMSGRGSTSDREKSIAAGFRHHLVKPFDPLVLDKHLSEAARELP